MIVFRRAELIKEMEAKEGSTLADAVHILLNEKLTDLFANKDYRDIWHVFSPYFPLFMRKMADVDQLPPALRRFDMRRRLLLPNVLTLTFSPEGWSAYPMWGEENVLIADYTEVDRDRNTDWGTWIDVATYCNSLTDPHEPVERLLSGNGSPIGVICCFDPEE